MADLKLDSTKDHQSPQECLHTDTAAPDTTNENLANDGYPSGLPLFLNLLAVGFATVLVGYVSLCKAHQLSACADHV